MLLALACLAASAGPTPHAAALERAGFVPLPDELPVQPGWVLLPVAEGLEVVGTDCYGPGAQPGPSQLPELEEALAEGTLRAPPPGHPWTEGPVVLARYEQLQLLSPTQPRPTEECLALLDRPEIRAQGIVVAQALWATPTLFRCGRLDSRRGFVGRTEHDGLCPPEPSGATALGMKLVAAAAAARPTGATTQAQEPPPEASPALLDPSLAVAQAPERFVVRFETTEGVVRVQVNRAWAPAGADRFYNLVQSGFYDQTRFFRVVSGFVAQIGISPYPLVQAAWNQAPIPDDPVVQTNTRGRVTFAAAGPNSRTTQIFFVLQDQTGLDRMGFAPFGEVIEGLEVMDAWYSGYGEAAPAGRGPDQGQLLQWGNVALDAGWPQLDAILSARVEEPG